MSYRFKLAIVAAALLPVIAEPAMARCTRLGFSVNDYGKDGPTKDAKDLLDKYIARWTAERGIKGYRVGKKDVKCELFLDFGFFDEHTCRAEATVCWGEGTTMVKPSEVTAPAAAPKPAPAQPKAPAPKQ
mgnify:CR=1 FL=1